MGERERSVSNTSIAIFRILFGLLMCLSMIRFWQNGWIESQYIYPSFHFAYFGFEWIKPLHGTQTYLIFFLAGLSSFLVAIGLFYRVSMVIFFLSFTYIELIDKAYYLNHYYFISILSLLLCLIPAHRKFSLDVLIFPKIKTTSIPIGFLWSLRLQLMIVYFFAGVAKIDSDWLLDAMPMYSWLYAKSDMPLVGNLLSSKITAYFFSWAGMLFDISIPFLVCFQRTKKWAIGMIIIFHAATAIFFPLIGMFPLIMIVCSMLFIDPQTVDAVNQYGQNIVFSNYIRALFFVHFLIQLLLPLRFLMYSGKLFWTEQGYRFSWRVMLMEKLGTAQFKVVDSNSKETIYIDNAVYLTALQEKMMSTQPDMILQFAHHLRDEYSKKGINFPQVYVENFAVLNGQGSRLLVDPSVDLAKVKMSLLPSEWILPYDHY